MAQLVKGHPQGLMTLFFSEMWERFCYYGMRVLLTLFLVKSLLKGDAEASMLYGAYTGLVYAAPILGGKMADQFLGYRYAVMLGAVLMAIGEFLILGGTETALLIGMGALIIGNGYFKANISTIVGKLYEDDDPRRDSGFTIFYIGINVGALLATTVVAYVGETYGFKYGFGLAGLGMLLGLFIFYAGRKNYAAAPGLNITEAGMKKVFGPLTMAHVVTIGSLLLIPLCYLLILNNSILDYIFLGLFLYVAYLLLTAGIREDKEQGTNKWRDRMIALIIFMVINVVFWACFEQAGTSLTLFADRNVDRSIFGWAMPASMTQFFNPFFIIVFGSIFSVMWVKLTKIGKNPSIPMKFALGIFQLGLGFLVAYVGFKFQSDNLVPILTLVFLYLLHTTGELFLSPIGLSMVTKLSPKKIAGTAMGAWFLSFAIANFVGGKIAALTGESHGGEQTNEAEFTGKTTVEKALAMESREGEFANWADFYSLPDGFTDGEGEKISGKVRNGIEVAKNISYGTFSGMESWLTMRESLGSGMNFAEWKAANDKIPTLKSASEWLDKGKWDALKQRYKKVIESDLKAETPGWSIDDWGYYSKGLDDVKAGGSLSLTDALEQMRTSVQKKQLDKYIHIFTILGLVLIGISILIAILSKPLNKLMHGVK
ncbi:MAG: peptide MFS transporter [Bacteroidia bacterium]